MSLFDQFKIKDQVVIITGGAGLIGRRHAEAVLEGDGIPVLLDIFEEPLAKVKKEFEEAKEYFLKCIKLGESNAEIYNELALCELGSGKRELAEAYLETACDLDDENLTTTTNLALLYLEDENYDRAREFLEKARFLAKEDKLVSHLIKKYEEKTGEKIGTLIHEELVKGNETSDGEDLATSFFNKMADTNIENKEECNCGENCNCNKGK